MAQIFHREILIKKKHVLSFAFPLKESRRIEETERHCSVSRHGGECGGMLWEFWGNLLDDGSGGMDMEHSFYHPLQQPQSFACGACCFTGGPIQLQIMNIQNGLQFYSNFNYFVNITNTDAFFIKKYYLFR